MITPDDWDHLGCLHLRPNFETYLNKAISWYNLGRKRSRMVWLDLTSERYVFWDDGTSTQEPYSISFKELARRIIAVDALEELRYSHGENCNGDVYASRGSEVA